MEARLTFAAYQRGLEEGKFLGLKCNRCHAVTFPPMAVCRSCQSNDLEISELAGRGVLRTFTVVRVAPAGKTPPYIVAMAELEEGAWALGNLEGIDPDDAGPDLIGRRVRLDSRPDEGDAYTGPCRVLTFAID